MPSEDMGVELPGSRAGGYGIGADEVAEMTHSANLGRLKALGGVAGVAALLHVDPKIGVENLDSETNHRQLCFGANFFKEKPPRGILFFVWEALQDFLVQILFVCAIASIAISIPTGAPEGVYDAVGIFIALFLIITVAAGSNYKQAQQFNALNKEKKKISVEATRGGQRCRVMVDDLVVGDIIHLATGDLVPSDGLIVDAHSLSVNESSLTGESELVHKGALHPFILAGCTVMDGFGDMLITAVGPRTEWGKVIEAITDDSDDPTPLQVRLIKVAELLGAMGIAIGVAIFLILSIRYLVTTNAFSSFDANDVRVLLNYFTIAITVLVIAIPEGLPLAVTLMLAFSVGKMMSDKCLVRHLQSCETMGCTTTICSDKTGTLTLNQMSVVQVWVAGVRCKPHAVGSEVEPSVLQLLLEAVSLNTSGHVQQPQAGSPPTVSGSPTEKALLIWSLSLGMPYDEARAAGQVLAVEPFNSSKKRMGVLATTPRSPAPVLHWKGAAELLLANCQFLTASDGGVFELTTQTRGELETVLKDMGSQSLRTLALAYREVTVGEQEEVRRVEEEDGSTELPCDNLVLLALLGIKDPCRPEVPEAVRQCQGAGIFVRMVTGDSKETATAIATECGILTPGGLVLEGAEFRNMPDADMEPTLERLQVVARASPTDKLMLVKKLRAAGEVVAVTGDGTNDGPALHEADVGLAMGLCGTEVAKESADIIILDDNFRSIVRGVVWGRSVFSNIQRFLQFQITVNCVALTLNFVSAVVTGDAPMTVVQMLWVDLIQDTLGAMSLATEPPQDNALLTPPVGRTDKIVTGVMWRNILGQSVYQLTLLCVLWFDGKSLLHLPGPPGVPTVIDQTGNGLPPGDAELVTIIFCTFVFMQIFNQMNSRKLEEWNVFDGMFKNPLFVSIIIIELVLQFIIAQFLGKLSGCVPLSASQWGLCFLLGIGCIPFGMITKLIPIPGQRHKQRIRGWAHFLNGDRTRFERLDQSVP